MTECGGFNVPVVSLSKDAVDLNKPETRNEINRNLAAVLSGEFVNPYSGWLRVQKVLDMYSINLPKIIFANEEDGEEIVELQQFGDRWGATIDGKITGPGGTGEHQCFLYYSYEISDNGFYDTIAVVVDESKLNDLLSDEDEDSVVHRHDTRGTLDPRQPK